MRMKLNFIKDHYDNSNSNTLYAFPITNGIEQKKWKKKNKTKVQKVRCKVVKSIN